MEEKPLSEKLVEGLETLYTKLTGNRAPALASEPGKAPDEETKDKAPATLMTLQELFARRQQEWKEKRITMNADNHFLRIPRVVMLKYLLPYFEVDEVCQLCAVCVCFNSLIKSTLFLHYYVSLHEKTGIAINLGDTTSAAAVPKRSPHKAKPADEKSAQEDAEVQREMLRKMREFLSTRLKESRDCVKTLKNDIHSLRGVLEAEKGTKEKALARAEQLENEISEHRRKDHSTVIMLENNISDIQKEVSFEAITQRRSTKRTRKLTS